MTERLHFHFSLFQLKTKEDVEGSGFGLCNGSDEIHMEIEKQSIDKQMFVVPCWDDRAEWPLISKPHYPHHTYPISTADISGESSILEQALHLSSLGTYGGGTNFSLLDFDYFQCEVSHMPVDWKKTHNLKVQIYILFRKRTEDCSLGDSLSDSSEELLQRGQGEVRSFCWKCINKNKCVVEYQKMTANHKKIYLKLMILVLVYIWESTRVWIYWNYFLDKHLN